MIVEDEPLARQTLRDFAVRADDLEFAGEAADGTSAVELINRARPDLVFLDVQLPEISGLEVLNKITFRPAIIFTTAFDQHAIRAFELEAVDYLLKPFGSARFEQTLERARRRLNETISPANRTDSSFAEPLDRIFARVGQRVVLIKIEDVVRLVAEDDYTLVFARGKSYLVNPPLHEFERRLPASQFCRVHRSAIVNLAHVSQFESLDRRILLHLSDNSKIVASRRGSKLLRDLIG